MEAPAPLSNRALAMLFVAALLLFVLGRLDVGGGIDGWLMPRIDAALAGRGIRAEGIERHGTALWLRRLSFADAALPPLDRVVLHPLWWASLRRLRPVAAFTLSGTRLSARGRLWREAGWLHFSDVQVDLAAAMVQPLLPPSLPVRLSGRIRCTGALQLDPAGPRPRQPDLRCRWEEAAATMGGGKPMALGLWRLSLTQGKAGWAWHIDGGPEGMVQGRGVVHATAGAVGDWKLAGKLTVKAGKGAAAGLLATLVGPGRHEIGGRVGAPELH